MGGIGEYDIATFDDITEVTLWNFDLGSDQLKEVKHRQVLRDTVIRALRQTPPGGTQPPFAHLIGKGSRLGTPEQNLRISRRRLESVAAFLIERGVDGSRITRMQAVGEERSFETEEDSPRDRAVIIQITQRPTATLNIRRLPRGGETLGPPSRLQLLLAGVLQSPAASRIRFRTEILTGTGIEVAGIHFSDVATALLHGQIDVLVAPHRIPANADAGYVALEDAFLLRHDTINDVGQAALIVHEAVHASCDIRMISITKENEEAAAYVAQCLFSRMHGQSKAQILGRFSLQEFGTFNNAADISLTLLNGGNPTPLAWLNLVSAVRLNPVYIARRSQLGVHNGLRRRRRFDRP